MKNCRNVNWMNTIDFGYPLTFQHFNLSETYIYYQIPAKLMRFPTVFKIAKDSMLTSETKMVKMVNYI